MSAPTDALLAENLRRWIASGQPLRWVEANSGTWDHRAWLVLLANLRHTEFWPLDPRAVGTVLEGCKQEKVNLRRWVESGQGRRWVEGRRGRWDHADWLSLLEDLRRSEFWPLRPEAVGRVLEECRREWCNLRLWQDSGQARPWVEARQGAWTHQDWVALVDSLRRSPFWPMNLAAVGEVLEEAKERYWNLRRWRDAEQGRVWVEAHQGQWDHDDWLTLVSGLRQSEFWPLPPGAVAHDLEKARRERHNLRRWQESGQPLRWVEAHLGQWDHADWIALLGDLQRSGCWPMHPAAVGKVLEDTKLLAAALPPVETAVIGQGCFGPPPASARAA